MGDIYRDLWASSRKRRCLIDHSLLFLFYSFQIGFLLSISRLPFMTEASDFEIEGLDFMVRFSTSRGLLKKMNLQQKKGSYPIITTQYDCHKCETAVRQRRKVRVGCWR
jgi:hypothetical protein